MVLFDEQTNNAKFKRLKMGFFSWNYRYMLFYMGIIYSLWGAIK